MSKKTTEPPRITEPDESTELGRGLIEPNNGEQQDPKQRTRECYAAIEQTLATYGCRIVPFLNTEPVGPDPVGKALISATFMVLPNLQNEEDHGR